MKNKVGEVVGMTALSKEAWDARKPLPPDVLVGALQDTVHKEIGKSRPAYAKKCVTCMEDSEGFLDPRMTLKQFKAVKYRLTTKWRCCKTLPGASPPPFTECEVKGISNHNGSLPGIFYFLMYTKPDQGSRNVAQEEVWEIAYIDSKEYLEELEEG